jgi:dipeptidyl aminopeptidase/acylaminoacyl peptidase
MRGEAIGLGLLLAVIISCGGEVAPGAASGPGDGPEGQEWPPQAFLAVDAMFGSMPEVRWDASGLLIVESSDGSGARSLDPDTGDEVPHQPGPVPVHDEARIVRPGLFAHRRPVRELPSPDHQRFAGTFDGDVWIRDAGGDERARLTAGGQGDFGFDIEGAKWSPDGELLAIKKLDSRGVPTIPLILYGEEGEPVDRIPYSRVGERIPQAALFIVSAEGGEPIPVELGEMDAPYLNIVGWSAGADSVFFLRASRLTRRVEFRVADAATGRSRLVLAEESDSYIVGLPFLHGNDAELDNEVRPVIPLDDGRFLWTSERDGWRRLYLYDFDGSLVRPLSPEGVEIVSVVAVDSAGEQVFFTALADRDSPYDQTLMRVPLSGGDAETVAAGPHFDEIRFDGAYRHFWALRMDADLPPVLELYRSDGSLVQEVWSTAGTASEMRWRPPQKFMAKAADGTTELHGLLYTPSGFDPSRSYPVIEHIYLGPFTHSVPQWPDARRQALADLGFVVVTVDARNTRGRGREFGDAFYGQYGQHEIADHAAVLRQLGRQHPYLDLSRVGVYGFSWGGYGVLRAMLLEPDLYLVGVAGAPAVDLEHFRVSIEPYLGCFPVDCPEVYERASNSPAAHRLSGKLLLMHGTSDDDVPFAETIRIIRALMEAGKPYDLAVYPEGNHGIGWRSHERYFWEQMTGYFLEHLGAPTN